MVIGSNSLRATGGFTWLLTSGPRGISRGARKLARIARFSTVIPKKKGGRGLEIGFSRTNDCGPFSWLRRDLRSGSCAW